MRKNLLFFMASVMLVTFKPLSVSGQETRLLRNPDVSDKEIVFSYAGDIWSVGRNGGEARRLTSTPAIESVPHFSRDGQTIAFTSNCTGNNEVYIISALGGEPKRITWHPGNDMELGWSADGKSLLISSDRSSAPIRLQQLFVQPVDGGMPVKLPVPSASRASWSNDGTKLAYEDIRWQSEWKNYRGGQAQPIRVVSFPDLEQIDVPGPSSVNTYPAFLNSNLYFLSDRDGIFNIFVFDLKTKGVSQVTRYTDSDIKTMSAGGGILVYEKDGVIHTLNPESGEDKTLSVTIHGDFPWAMKQWKDVSKNIAWADLSPNGTRAVFEARGEIFTVPAEKGDVRNLTNSSGAADRTPAWSPDGQKIAWFSDASGEYQLIISDQNGLVPPKAISIEKPTFFYNLCWSPDSKKVAFTNAERDLLIVDVEKGTVQKADYDLMAVPERSLIPVWSPDSRWIAYSKQLPNKYRAVMLYNTDGNKSYQITDGLSDCVSPAWDKGGKYLYFLASTDMALNTGWLDMSSMERPQRRNVYFAILSKDGASPLLPESDEEKAVPSAAPTAVKKAPDTKKSAADIKKPTADTSAIKIDLEGISNRILSLPVPPRNYFDLQAGPKGFLFISETDWTFSPTNAGNMTIHKWDMSKRKDDVYLTGATSYTVSATGSKVLYSQGEDWFIIAADGKPNPGDGKLKMELKTKLDPEAEWKQIYLEAWRFHRDFFYVPNYHGADWKAIYNKYAALLPYVKHRSDLNYLIDMIGGELCVGHHFVNGGDMGETKYVSLGLLGADYAIESNTYRIKKILSGESWNPDLKTPLLEAGVNVHAGDYIIAVNGVPLTPPSTPESALEGMADKQVTLTVNSTPSLAGARNVTVVPVGSESSLRMRTWIEDNRKEVDRLSDGALAYVWLPNTGEGGYSNFNRYYFGQQDKKGAVMDERFNGGGSIADYIIDILSRNLLGYFNNPIGNRVPWTEPMTGIWGPKVMLINEYAGSGGDMMPYMFRQKQVGKLIGTKTWGGLVGIWDFPQLIDGGFVTIPRGGFFNLKGEWDIENKGIEPDIEVNITPKDVAAGRDPQLESAVMETMKLLKESPVILQKEPLPPVKVH
jgi:tricorn protease